MGLFGRRKGTDATSSVLSESETQKKLYGDFADKTSHAVIGDRDSFREPVPSPSLPKESSPEKETPFDLFSAQKDALSETTLSPRHVFPDPKPTEHPSRYVPLHDFEKKPTASVPVSSGSDSYARFRYNQPDENKWNASLGLLKGFSGKMSELFKFILDPEQVVLRRIFYWGAAILVVFLLFGGVNALNSQREEAMRGRYKIPGESASVKTPNAVTAVVSNKSVTERPVVITPAPVRPKKVRVPEGGTTVAAPMNASYVIQVVTYPTKQDADQAVNTFRRAGFRAFIKENSRPSGRLFYLVLLGNFHTEAEAQAQLLKFRAKDVSRPFQDAFVKSSRS